MTLTFRISDHFGFSPLTAIRARVCAYRGNREFREIKRNAKCPLCGCSEADDWLAAFDERAGFLEFDGGYSREEAERMAYADTCTQLGPPPGGWADPVNGVIVINGSETNDRE